MGDKHQCSNSPRVLLLACPYHLQHDLLNLYAGHPPNHLPSTCPCFGIVWNSQVTKPLNLDGFYPHASKSHMWFLLSSNALIFNSDKMGKMGIIKSLFYQEFHWWLSSKESPCNGGDAGLISGWWRFPGGGNGNPFQYSCLKSPMDRTAWWATVHGFTKSQTWLRNYTTVYKMPLFVSPVCARVFIWFSKFRVSGHNHRPCLTYRKLRLRKVTINPNSHGYWQHWA